MTTISIERRQDDHLIIEKVTGKKKIKNISGFANMVSKLNNLIEIEKDERKKRQQTVIKILSNKCNPGHKTGESRHNKILEITEKYSEYLQVLKILFNNGFINEKNHCIPGSRFRYRMILLGVIYLMIHSKFFYPTIVNKNFIRKKLTDKEIVRIISEQWNMQRLDQIHVNKNRLMELACDNIPELKDIVLKKNELTTQYRQQSTL